ncbi:MAG TPA: hypothetical protein DCY13_14745, partial [Verrucomicrobiales bacterium]|nr:hypothetical protein [Verrucomicrobiales bacterium]
MKAGRSNRSGAGVAAVSGSGHRRPGGSPLVRLGALLCLLIFLPVVAADEPDPDPSRETTDPPTLRIRGLGLIDNRKLKRLILQTHPEKKQGQPFDSNFIEDAFVVLRNHLNNDGYQEAVVHAELMLTSGELVKVDWNGKTELEVPRPLAVKRARFGTDRGPLFHFEALEIHGLSAIPVQQATEFFYKTDMLLRLKSNRRFSRSQLNNSVANLRQHLVNLGHRNAAVTVTELTQDTETGAVRVKIDVEEGRMHRVAGVNVVVMDPGGIAVAGSQQVEVAEPWSPHWQQDFALQLRNEQYRRGRPDARARLDNIRSEERAGVVFEHLEARVDPGPEVELGDVRFEGYRKTR